MKLRICKLKYHMEFDSSIESYTLRYSWLDTYDNQIYTDEEMKEMNPENDINFNYDYRYLKIPKLDAFDVKKKFIAQLNNKKITSAFEKADEKNFGRLFVDLIYRGRIVNYPFTYQWFSYYDKVLTDFAVKWCKENHIPYVL